MAIIIPAILESDKERFADKVYAISRLTGVETIQVDFCDGKFVESHSLPPKELDVLNPAYTWEAHVMAENPTEFLEYKMLGFSKIIVHYEAFASETELEEALGAITSLGLSPAIAINPETSVSVLRYFTDTIKYFTLLSVHPGKQGAEFLPESPARLAELRNLAPNAILEVDGGANLQNAGILAKTGADQIAVGSALFVNERLQENFDELTKAASGM
jgi:ribulose-phosphate 3-epimerase